MRTTSKMFGLVTALAMGLVLTRVLKVVESQVSRHL